MDYTTPIAVTSGLTFTTPALAVGTDTTFVVRAYDSVSNLEEANTQAKARIQLGTDGSDLTGVPNPPHAVWLGAIQAGGCRVSWGYAAAADFAAPVGFYVYLSSGATVDYSTPAGTIAYIPGRIGYSLVIPGPLQNQIYTAAVQSYSAAGVGAGVGSAGVLLGVSSAPFLLDSLECAF